MPDNSEIAWSVKVFPVTEALPISPAVLIISMVCAICIVAAEPPAVDASNAQPSRFINKKG